MCHDDIDLCDLHQPVYCLRQAQVYQTQPETYSCTRTKTNNIDCENLTKKYPSDWSYKKGSNKKYAIYNPPPMHVPDLCYKVSVDGYETTDMSKCGDMPKLCPVNLDKLEDRKKYICDKK